MSNEPVSNGFRACVSLFIGALLCVAPPAQAQQSAGGQAQVLADQAARILECSVHPCLGDSEEDVRQLLKGKIVSDGVFDYSDLEVAYPPTKDVLRGLVEWDLDGGLDAIYLKIIDFHVEPSVLIAEIERTLPGCEMEQEPGDGTSADEEGDVDETQEWSCEAEAAGTDGILVEIYFVPGLLLFEIGS